MLTQMQQRFGEMNDNIVGRIDEMGRKIDELEHSIGELVNEAQADQPRDGQQQQNRAWLAIILIFWPFTCQTFPLKK